jgi:hypothetical protein
MKESVTKCNHCGAEIVDSHRLLTLNDEEIDLCSDQCRLKWWMAIVDEAESASLEIHITSKPGIGNADELVDSPKRNFKMLPGK